MTHGHSFSTADRRDAAFLISRRNFFAASTVGLAALAAAPSAPARTLDKILLDPRRLYWNTVHVRWQLGTYRDHFLPDAILTSCWEEIRNLLRLPASAEPSSLFRVKPRRLIRCFRRLPADDYFRLAYGLVQLFPAVPARFFAIPDKHEFDGTHPLGSSGLHSSPGIRDRVSHLLGDSLEFLANNDFLRLWPLVKRVELCGSWLPFIAGQVLDVLYQKTLVLTWLHRRASAL